MDGFDSVERNGDDWLAIGRECLLLVLIDSQSILSYDNVPFNIRIEVIEAELVTCLGEQDGFCLCLSKPKLTFLVEEIDIIRIRLTGTRWHRKIFGF